MLTLLSHIIKACKYLHIAILQYGFHRKIQAFICICSCSWSTGSGSGTHPRSIRTGRRSTVNLVNAVLSKNASPLETRKAVADEGTLNLSAPVVEKAALQVS
jgi:hypothetical protein